MLEKVPDRQAAEWVVSRIDWKYALHLSLTYAGFHFYDLCAFRARLIQGEEERLVFEEILERLKAMGLVKRRGKARTDSTHLLAMVERLTLLELVGESIRVALRAVKIVVPQWVEEHLPAAFVETYEQRQSQYGLGEDKVQEELVKVGQDGFWFLSQLDQSAPGDVRELAQVATLRTVLSQQFPEGPGKGPAPKQPHGKEVIESPHETEARRGVKRDKAWTGYKTQVTETCDEGLPHLISDLDVTLATAHDGQELDKIQARLEAQDTLPSSQYADQIYISGKNIAESRKRGIDLKGKALADTSGPKGFRQTDFQIDEVKREAVCPAGEKATVWGERFAKNGEPAMRQVLFSGHQCQACRFFGQCTKSLQGRRLELHPYREVLEERRAEAETEDYREEIKVRAGVEGTVSELVRAHGLRRARYRGLGKVRPQGLFTAAAVNLKRAMRWLSRPENEQREAKGTKMAGVLATA